MTRVRPPLAQAAAAADSAAVVQALFLSLSQLGDRAILAVLAKSLAVTLALFAAAGTLLWWGIDAALAGWRHHGAIAGVAATLFVVLAAWLLFRAIAVAVVGVFADDVVAAVEARHYPAALATARAVGLARGAAMGARSAARFVAVNLLLVPVYLVALATGPGAAIPFFVANAWLLGRDLGDMVAVRHLPPPALPDWRRRTRGWRFALGLAGTGLFVVPLLNILAPILGAAMATHLFHRSRA